MLHISMLACLMDRSRDTGLAALTVWPAYLTSDAKHVQDAWHNKTPYLQDRNFQDNSEFFQNCFEAGRRFKIMNPDKMRSEYGKLVYLLMDSSDDHVQDLLEFKCVRPLRTVYTLLEDANGLAVLQDPLVEAATAEIVAGMLCIQQQQLSQ